MKTLSTIALALLVVACGGESSSGSTAASSSGSEASGAGDVTPTHGAVLWGVYVVVAPPGAPELEAAAGPLRDRGLFVSVGEVACDEGAAEALGAASDAHAVSVMFATREDAERFAQTLSSPAAGIAQVTVRCAD